MIEEGKPFEVHGLDSYAKHCLTSKFPFSAKEAVQDRWVTVYHITDKGGLARLKRLQGKPVVISAAYHFPAQYVRTGARRGGQVVRLRGQPVVEFPADVDSQPSDGYRWVETYMLIRRDPDGPWKAIDAEYRAWFDRLIEEWPEKQRNDSLRWYAGNSHHPFKLTVLHAQHYTQWGPAIEAWTEQQEQRCHEFIAYLKQKYAAEIAEALQRLSTMEKDKHGYDECLVTNFTIVSVTPTPKGRGNIELSSFMPKDESMLSPIGFTSFLESDEPA